MRKTYSENLIKAVSIAIALFTAVTMFFVAQFSANGANLGNNLIIADTDALLSGIDINSNSSADNAKSLIASGADVDVIESSATSTTFYYVYTGSALGTDKIGVYIKFGSNDTTEKGNYMMTDTGKTHEGHPIYKLDFSFPYNGYYAIYFQKFDKNNNWKANLDCVYENNNSWNTDFSFNGKMRYNSKWINYQVDVSSHTVSVKSTDAPTGGGAYISSYTNTSGSTVTSTSANSATVKAGTPVTFTAKAVDGYSVEWSGATGTTSGNTFTVSSVTSDITVTAKYYIPTYQIACQKDMPSDYYDANPKENMTFLSGTTYTKTLTLNANSTYGCFVVGNGHYFKVNYTDNTAVSGSHTLSTTLTDYGTYNYGNSPHRVTFKTSTSTTYTFNYNTSTNVLTISTISIHTVTFNANGHGTAPANQTVEDGKTATEPTDPTATGYTFGGWYTDKACTTAYDFTTTVTKDITLYAKWTAKKYTVQFTGDSTNTTGTGTFDYNTSVTVKYVATFNHYITGVTGYPDGVVPNFINNYTVQLTFNLTKDVNIVVTEAPNPTVTIHSVNPSGAAITDGIVGVKYGTSGTSSSTCTLTVSYDVSTVSTFYATVTDSQKYSFIGYYATAVPSASSKITTGDKTYYNVSSVSEDSIGIKNVKSDVEIYAVFAPMYKLTVNYSNLSSLKINTTDISTNPYSVYLASGTAVNINAVADEDHKITNSSWNITGVTSPVLNNSSANFTVASSDITVTITPDVATYSGAGYWSKRLLTIDVTDIIVDEPWFAAKFSKSSTGTSPVWVRFARKTENEYVCVIPNGYTYVRLCRMGNKAVSFTDEAENNKDTTKAWNITGYINLGATGDKKYKLGFITGDTDALSATEQ